MYCVVVLWVCVWTRQAWFSVKGSITMPGCVQPQGKIWNSECVLWNTHINSRNKSGFSVAGLHVFQQFSLFICLSVLIFHQRRLSTQTFVRHTQLLCWKTFFPYSVFPFLSCHRNKACWEVPAPVAMQRAFVLLSKQMHGGMKVFWTCKHNRGSQISQNCFH